MRKHSPRVEAWIYTVINPIIDSLRIERNFLEKHNWTCRYYSKKVEYINPIKAYLDYTSLPNYDDFLLANPQLKEPLERHDELLKELDSKCVRAFEYLMENEEFQNRVLDLLKKYTQNYSDRDYPGGAVSQQDFSKLIAQHIINTVKELPEYHTSSFFWSLYGNSLVSEFRIHEVFTQLDRAGEELYLHDQILLKTLEGLRFELCEKYDIPAAPVPA